MTSPSQTLSYTTVYQIVKSEEYVQNQTMQSQSKHAKMLLRDRQNIEGCRRRISCWVKCISSK